MINKQNTPEGTESPATLATLGFQEPSAPVGQPEAGTQPELERVREIILGPDVTQKWRKPEIDRLREMIFGAQMQDYERRFADLEREMERVLSDLRQAQDTIGELEKAQAKRIEAFEREMRRTNEELRRDVERLRAQEPTLQQLLTRGRQQEILGQTLNGNSREVRQTLTQQEQDIRTLKATVGEYRAQHERQVDALKREMRQAEDSLRVELRRLVERLEDQKTDRRALASMLLEVATRLQSGSNMTVLLEDLADETHQSGLSEQ